MYFYYYMQLLVFVSMTYADGHKNFCMNIFAVILLCQKFSFVSLFIATAVSVGMLTANHSAIISTFKVFNTTVQLVIVHCVSKTFLPLNSL